MKKTLLFVFSLIYSAALMAQLPVSQTPQNKKVLLEEYTGIKCTYCPDGHKRAVALEAANPGNVFLINIHEGSFSVPSAGDPDFRTSFGTALAAQTGLTGYPSGTISRHIFPPNTNTALGRGDWATNAPIILAQSSYVNVAHADTINLSTRELKVVVQVYFTGTTAPASVNLNIALLQDNVEGPQTGMSSNPTQVLPNGKYNHMHMLRHLLTGQWGDTITTTAMGTLITRTYTYTLPAAINSVPLDMANLRVIAFIAQTHQEVITANGAPMNFLAPAGLNIVDMSAFQTMTLPGLCDYTVTPKVTIKNNNTTITADTFNVQYILNTGTPVSQHIVVPLAPGDSTIITFPNATLSPGINKLEYSVNFTGVTHLIDMFASNSKSSTPLIYTLKSVPFGRKINEGFETTTTMTGTPPNTLIKRSGSTDMVVVKVANLSSSSTQPVGGYGKSANSLFWYFTGTTVGTKSTLIYEKLNLNPGTGHRLKFDYSYGKMTGKNDRLLIEYSLDCGTTWVSAFDKSGNDLGTCTVTAGFYIPTATQWASADISIPAIDGKSEVLFRFNGISDAGACLFVDNIGLFNSVDIGIENTTNELETMITYPNPAQNNVNIDLNLVSESKVNVEIYNSLGQVVATENFGTLTSGSQNLQVNTSNLSDGYYTIKVIANDNIKTTPLVIKK